MTRFSLSGSFRKSHLLLIAFVALSACTDREPTGLSPSAVASARSAGTNGPTVKLTDPDTATVDTTLNVHVFGSGYDQGSRANWAFKGVVSDKIVTNSTVFVSSTELVANITIARNANLGSHDVIVTTSAGKGGIGTELFVVTLKTVGLGTLGGLTSQAMAINNLGQVVGNSLNATGQIRAFLWTKSGGMRDLGTLGGTVSQGLGIDDAGRVVGTSTNVTGASRAYMWTEADGMRDLGPADSDFRRAASISGNGGVALEGPSTKGLTVGVWHWSSGVAEEINTLVGQPLDVNNSSQVVGTVNTDPLNEATRQAVIWTRSTDGWQERLLGFLTGGNSSEARGINNAGQVVGYSHRSQGGILAFAWTAAEGMKQLPNVSRGEQSRAYSISNSGDIVGYTQTRSSVARATLWSPVAGGWNVIDLAGALYGQSVATGVNDVGQIVGAGVLGPSSAERQQAILWEFR